MMPPLSGRAPALRRALAVLLVSHAAFAGFAAAQPHWTEPQLSPRFRGAAAYDSARAKVVLFGGFAGPRSGSPATWDWDGSEWERQFPATSPLARFEHCIAYDSARARTIVFGGRSHLPGVGVFNDTWEFDGATWVDRSATGGPNQRRQAAMAYDSNRGVTVLFGGLLAGDDTASNQTWEWNGTAWTLRTSTGPAARFGHALAYDAERAVTVLFGGVVYTAGNPPVLNDETWEWNGSAWSQRFIPGPSPRRNHAMAMDVVRGAVVLFGGTTDLGGAGVAETWEYNGTAWTQRASPGPSGRASHSMAYDSQRRVTVLNGGITFFDPTCAGCTRYENDTWEWDGVNWIQVSGSAWPAPRDETSMAFDESRARTVLFGGATYGSNFDPLSTVYHGDTWVWTGQDWTRRSNSGPVPRTGALLCYDSARNVTVLFAGRSQASIFEDTWEWNGNSWSRRATSGPIGGSAMVYEAARGLTVMPLPSDGQTEIQTWEWNGSAWTERAVTGPAPWRTAYSLSYDAARERIVLFGGVKPAGLSNEFLSDTWEWDGQAWARVAQTGPQARAGAVAWFDAGRAVTVLRGGYIEPCDNCPPTLLVDEWEWDGTTWTQADYGPVQPPCVSAGAFDTVRNRYVAYTGGCEAGVWELVAPECPPDFDGDGFVTGADFDAYVGAFESGEASADFDGDGFVTGLDFDLFVVAFDQGC